MAQLLSFDVDMDGKQSATPSVGERRATAVT